MGKVQIDQRTSEWKKWRQEGITATDLAPIMDKSPFKKALQVYKDKMGLSIGFLSNAMQRGNKYEEEARERANKKFEMNFVPCCYEHNAYPWARASLDGIYKDTVLEIKIPTENNFGAFDEVPFHYQLQMQWQMFVSDAKEAIYFVYSPELKAAEYFLLERNEELIEQMFEEASAFYHNHVLAKVPPHTLPINASDEAAFLVKMYKQACLDEKEAIRKKAEIKENLLNLVEHQECKVNGATIREIKRTSLDKEAMKKDGINLEKYNTRCSKSWKINIENSKSD